MPSKRSKETLEELAERLGVSLTPKRERARSAEPRVRTTGATPKRRPKRDPNAPRGGWRKAECKHGHDLTDTNNLVYRKAPRTMLDGTVKVYETRECKTCHRNGEARRRARLILAKREKQEEQANGGAT